MYLAPLSDCSYTSQSPCPAGVGAPWHANAPMVNPKEKRMRLMCYGTLGPSIVAPPCSRVTLVALPASIVNVNRSAGSNATPNT